MSEPLKAGDPCEVIGGFGREVSPNLGLKVTVKHRMYGDMGGDHREFGPMYRCEGEGVSQLNDMGAYVQTGWADFAGIWLHKLPKPPPTESTTTTESELTA